MQPLTSAPTSTEQPPPAVAAANFTKTAGKMGGAQGTVLKTATFANSPSCGASPYVILPGSSRSGKPVAGKKAYCLKSKAGAKPTTPQSTLAAVALAQAQSGPKAHPVGANKYTAVAATNCLSTIGGMEEVAQLTDYDHEELLQFYRGNIANIHGTTITVCQSDFLKDQEKGDLYFQWMWPTKYKTEGQEAARAPIFGDDFIKMLQGDKDAVVQAKLSLKSILEFYGLQLTYDSVTQEPKIEKSTAFVQREAVWCFGRRNPHYGRISRMLESLQHFGLKTEALAFTDCLSTLFVEDKTRFHVGLLIFWSNVI